MIGYEKYKKIYPASKAGKRLWPSKEITKAPIWCSTDLRDGNQALVTPMRLPEKLKYFDFLVSLGFREIEVAFPAASDTEFSFVRQLITENRVPEDVTLQVLTQARPHIIDKTIAAIEGAKSAIIHLYLATSPLARRVVFSMSRQEILHLAVDGAAHIRRQCPSPAVRFEFSPEHFMCTEPAFALEICQAVLDEWQPTKERPVILNLPATVEVSSPNVYADRVEYMAEALRKTPGVILSVHAHNDRGCGVAATELALMAGATRVEGTLFGNGERTGNADLMVLALNLFSQGIDPGLHLEKMDEIAQAYTAFTHLPIHPRHPYAGDLVFTAFSGSHQDAIRKGWDAYNTANASIWENPYLPVNPADLGRQYEPVRINSQSGRGGLMFILENKFGVQMPQELAREFSQTVTKLSDAGHTELTPQSLYALFQKEYVNIEDALQLCDYEVRTRSGSSAVNATLSLYGKMHSYTETGNGPLDAMSIILRRHVADGMEIAFYHEHALAHGASSAAMAYIAVKTPQKEAVWGVGVDTNISAASIKALISAVNRFLM